MANEPPQPTPAASPEIASVGIGVRANIAQLQEGMAQAQATVQQTAAQVKADATKIETAVEQASAKAGASAARAAETVKVSAAAAAQSATESAQAAAAGVTSAVSETSSFAKGLKRAQNAFTNIFNSLFVVPSIAASAFALGKTIGEKIFHGMADTIAKKRAELVAQAQVQIADAQADILAAISKAQKEVGQPPIDPNIFKNAQAEIAAVSEEIKRAQRAVETLRGTYERLKKQQDALTEGTEEHDNVVALTERTWQDVLEAQVRLNQLIEQRHRIEDRYNQILQRGKGILEDQAKLTAARAAEERRLNAQRDVAAERMAVDISRLRQLMELGIRQKYPVAPGAQVIRGGEGNIVR